MARNALPFSTLPYIFFILLFPGTIIYYVAITSGAFPPLSSGYFGIVSAGSLALLTPIYAWNTIKHGKINSAELLYLCFLLFFSSVVLINRSSSNDSDTFTWHMISIAQSLSVFLICKGAARTESRPGMVLIASWALVSACMMYFTVGGRFSLREMSDQGQIPSYQTFALCYFLLSFMMISGIKHIGLRIVVNLVAITCLYINGARSEFVGYIIFSSFFEFLISKNKGIPLISAIIILTSATIVASSGIIELPESRITNLIDLQNDNSSNERDRIASEGLNKILNSPILGDYGNYEKGEYIHNILSAWLDLGIAGIILLIITLAIPTSNLILSISVGPRQNQETLAVFSMLISSILLLLVGKYFTYLMIPAAIGFYSSTSILAKAKY